MFKKPILLSLIVFLSIIIGTLLLIILLSNTDNDKSPEINASFYPLGYFTDRVLGEEVTSVVVPAGIEPHDYEPTAEDIVNISQGELFIYNGNGLEAWVEDFLKTPEGQDTQVFKASDHYMSLKIQETDDILDENSDPHFWLDPIRVADVVDDLTTKLNLIYPNRTEEFDQHSTSFNSELLMLDNEYREGLKTCKQNKIIVSHEAYNYLGDRYGIEIISISGISPEEDPSSKKMSEISDIAKKEGIKYIFFESLVSPDLAETIANESGAKTLVLNPIENLTKDERLQGEDYMSIMRSNLVNLRTAMECQ